MTLRLVARNSATESENRIHADDVARRHGFRGGLVPGVTIYGYMMQAVSEAPQFARVRLRKPVFDGDELVITREANQVTAYRGALPQDSTNFKGDYGPSDFDSRNIFTGFISYDVPGSSFMPALTKGWQVNSLLTLHSGSPFSVYSSSDTSVTNDGNQRANLVPGVDPYKGFRKGGVVNGQGLNWLNPAAFVDAPAGTWGTTSRNQFVGPGYGDVDLSVFKNTHIWERVTTQFRVEMFNILNKANYAPPLNNYNPSYSATNDIRSPYRRPILRRWRPP